MHALAKLHSRHIAIVACCCLTCLIPAGMLMNTPSIFYPVIADDLGVQTAEISAWMAICLLSAAVFQPVLGNIVNRVSMRLLMLGGSFTMVAVFLVFSAATEPWMFWAVAVFTGFPFAACLSVGPATLVNRWFNERVGLILGFCAASSAIGGVLFMLLGQALIESVGWRTAYLVYAGIIVVVCMPAIMLCIRDYPADCGLKPYGQASDEREDAGEANHPSAEPAAAAADIAQRARRCMVSPAFLLLIVAGFLMNMVCQVNGYLPKYVYWIDDQAVLGVASVAFVSGVVLSSLAQAGSAAGKLILGAFSDFSVRNALILLCAGGAAGIACVWALPSTPLVVVGGFVYGFFLAAVLVLIPMLVREIFGAGDLYPVLYARVAIAPAIGGATANIVWPYLADNFGGFDIVFSIALVMTAVILICSLAALRLGKS